MDEQQKEEDLWGWGMEREKAMDAQYILIVYYNYYIYLYIYKPQSINKTLIKLEISKEASFFFFYTFVFLIFFYIWTLQGSLFFSSSYPILKSTLLFKLLLDRTSASLRIQHFFSWLLWNEGITTMTITTTQRRDSKWSKRKEDFHATAAFKSPPRLWKTTSSQTLEHKNLLQPQKDAAPPFDPVYVYKRSWKLFSRFSLYLLNVNLLKNTQNPSC